MFITSTTLDFGEVFVRPETKQIVLESIIRQHQIRNAILDAYVVMSNHIHLLTRLPEEISVSRFVQRLKIDCSRRVLPTLTPREVQLLSRQSGLDNRKLWQRSFRSVVILSETTHRQKMSYIHTNPVRAELVALPEEYHWSSSRLLCEGKWSEERGLMDSLPIVSLD
ncbi:MAG: transposase [Fimbriimonadaceae bacterium]|nr:transposase [Fimbriimonadaceae bacterium]